MSTGLPEGRIKMIAALVREGGFAVFAVLLLFVCCYQQHANVILQKQTARVIEANTRAIESLETEIREIRLTTKL